MSGIGTHRPLWATSELVRLLGQCSLLRHGPQPRGPPSTAKGLHRDIVEMATFLLSRSGLQCKEMTGLLHCFLTLFGGGDWKGGGGLLRAIPSYALIVTGHRVLVHLPCLIITLEAVPFVTEDVRRHDRISSCQDHQQGWARSGR